MGKNALSVFTKPWKCSTAELGEKMAALGVDGIELPVRPGYPVNEDNIKTELPKAAMELKRFGLQIISIAGPTTEAAVEACSAAGVGIIRTMARIDMQKGYMKSVDEYRKLYEQLIPSLERNGVTVGVQNHCDMFVGSAIGLVHLLDGFSPRQVGAVLDLAHCGLDGEPDAMAIDIAWPHLIMINLKNAFRLRINGPEAEARWRTWWTTGRHGYSSWRKTVEVLKQRGYAGPICLPAEYTNFEGGDVTADNVIPLLIDDIAYVRSLLS